MGFNFDGYVLRPPLVSPVNAAETAEPETGVLRHVSSLPSSYDLNAPAFIDVRADQYRTAILEAPGTSPTEYLVWAANTGTLAMLDDPAWWTEEGSGYIPVGEETVTIIPPAVPEVPPPQTGYQAFDGTLTVVVRDDGGRTLGTILAIVVVRGDVTNYDDAGWADEDDPSQGRLGGNPYPYIIPAPGDQNPVSGVVTITDASIISALGGGLSQERGDTIFSVRYTVAPAKFWWTRNDRYETRFGWNATTQKWEPYKGSAPIDLGLLQPSTTYQMDPRVKNLPVNSYLPGDAGTPNEYSMIRLGVNPSLASPVGNIRVRPNAELEEDYDFTLDPSANGVVGQSNGILQFNPAFVEQNAGKNIWYTYKGFSSTADGIIGKLQDALANPLFLAPIPGPTDACLLRIGNRHYLDVLLMPNDFLLSMFFPGEGEAVVSLSTGQVRLSSADVRKADPTSPFFDKHYLGEDVVYDGVALNQVPQPTTKPAPLIFSNGVPAVVGSGDLYIPAYQTLPVDFADASDDYRGLGISGVLDVPDGTGALPQYPALPASVRPGGETLVGDNTGRVRQIDDGVSDTILFGVSKSLITVNVVDRDSDLPASSKVKKGEAWVSREPTALFGGGWGSKVVLGSKDTQVFQGQPFYFLQPTFTPATYTEEARIYSRSRDIFRFSDNQTLYFAIDGIAHRWTAPTLKAYYTAEEVASSIMTTSIPLITSGQAYAQNGRVVLEAGIPVSGTVEIGWGGTTKNLSGAEVMGFLPGWRVQGGVPNWLPDSGATLGMFRSPVNLDRVNATPDSKAEGLADDILISDAVQANPFMFMSYPPLQDIAGYADGVFFSLQTTIIQGESVQVVNKPLVHYKDIIHRFGQKRFDWVQEDALSETVDTAVSLLDFGQLSLIPESLLGAPGIGGGLYVSEDGGATNLQEADRDYVLPQGGDSGVALLVHRYGGRHSYGAQGQVIAGSTQFSDPDADFTAVQPGYRLKIQSSGLYAGSYIVESVVDSTTLEVSPAFPGTAAIPVVWEVFEGYPDSVYDPALVADQMYKDFNHLSDEPFKVRLLSYLGLTPASDSAQRASRLKADLGNALASNRPISLRYGLTQATIANTASLTALTQVNLGTLANLILTIPDTSTNRFVSQSFSIKIGTSRFSHDGVSLLPVTAFTPNLPSGIEYLTVPSGVFPVGRLNFGADILAQYASATVYYVEEFQPAADLQALTAEYDPNTGFLNLAEADFVSQAGKKVYFVEQMVTEQQLDVTLNPIAGTFAFSKPVPVKSAVEVSYWKANLEGRKEGDAITEFLPTFVRNEIATRIRENQYLFSPGGNTVDQDIDPVVYIGPIQQNFGSKVDYLVDYPTELNGQGRLTFISHTVPDYVPVQVSYAIYEAQGGELAYDSSQRPVYRPPFFITAGQNQFGLRGDRASEFHAGQMLRIGAECFYVRGTRYYASSDVTGIYIFPPTLNEVGSRAPGHDVITVITGNPITTVVDPDGDAPVPTSAPVGFMSAIDIGTFPFDPISRGSREVVFSGDLTQFAVPGHILEIGGRPYTIAQVSLDTEGARTKITVTTAFPVGFNIEQNPTVKLSYRPVYPPSVRDFVGLGPLVVDEGYELVRFDGKYPGQTLRPFIDYSIAEDTGAVSLLENYQEPLQAGGKLFLSHTQLRTLQPFMKDGVLGTPRYDASFLYGVVPDTTNGYLGAQVIGRYTFRNPDSFYFRAVRLPAFLSEATQEAILEITSKQPASGAQIITGGTENWENGRLGIKGERRNLTDKDRAARTFLDFYNQTIETFEQVTETISGGFIGDRDGKFRFFVGHGKEWFTPGYEDAITGNLQVRNVWSEVFNEANPALDMTFIENDWVVDPRYASMVNGELDNWFPGSSYLKKLLNRQEALVHNDVDDVVMLRAGRKRLFYTFPIINSRAKGIYAPMYQQHQFSRLFPTVTKAFTYTGPGIGGDVAEGDFGYYTWGRFQDGEFERTYGTTIGQLQNPVHGELGNVSTANLSKRYARGRVWAYLPDGIPAGVFAGGTSPAINRPVIIAFPTLLRDIPIDPGTGFPDDTQLLSQGLGGTIPDAVSGDPDLAVPGFVAGDQLQWGQPDGTSYELCTSITVNIFAQFVYTGVFVEEVLYGCVITLMDVGGTSLTSPNDVRVIATPGSGIPLNALPVQQGDTVSARSPSASTDVLATGTPTLADQMQMLSGRGDYRTGTDISVKTDGRLVDITLPSFDDPNFGIKELVGQNPPNPMTALEGEVEFFFDGQNPFEFPALQGLLQDDSGDYQIPYLKTGNTELDRFGELGDALPRDITTVDGIASLAVYPSEVLGNDGSVVGAIGVGFLASEPATLLSQQADILDLTHTGNPGTGDAAPYDLLFMQVGNSITAGATGIHSVGRASYTSGSLIEPPRFPTHTADLDAATKVTPALMRYSFENYAVYVDPASPVYVPDPQVGIPPPGVEIIENTLTNEVLLDFQSVGFPILYDGLTAGIGGLNDIQVANPNNIIRIDVYSRPDPNISEPATPPPYPTGGKLVISFFLQNNWAWTIDYRGVVTGPFLAGITYGFNTTQIRILPLFPNSIMPWGAAVVPGHWVIPHSFDGTTRQTLYGLEFTVSVNTISNGGIPPGPPVGAGNSQTAWVSPDRLTFNEVIDMRYMKPRDYTHPLSGVNMESRLLISQVQQIDGAGNPFWCDLLGYANGGTPFTFLTRPTVPITQPLGLGTWVDATATPTVERGTCRVMAFEGDGNTPVLGTDLTFSVAPSNANYEGGEICSGTGLTESQFNANLGVEDQRRYDNRVTEITVGLGAVSNVVPGDILVINGSVDPNNPGTTKAGTYLVRHAVEPTGVNPYRETLPDTTAGTGGWCPMTFPETVSFDASGETLTVEFDDGADPTYTFPPAVFPFTERVYVIRNLAGLSSADASIFQEAAISAQYTSIISSGNQAVFSTADYRDSLGNALTAAQFKALLGNNRYQVSGMQYLPMQVGGELGLPENNCVGWHDVASPLSVYGARYLTLSTQNIFGAVTTDLLFDATLGANPGGISTASGVDWVAVYSQTPADAHTYVSDTDTPVYHNVPRTLDISGFSLQLWADLNRVTGSAEDAILLPNQTRIRCLLPTTRLALGDLAGPTEGFYAQGGIFLEPSFPRSALNLDVGYPRVVDSSHSLPDPVGADDEDREVGMRDAAHYGSVAVVPDAVTFEVRRIRRFHEKESLGDSFNALRYAYEIRRGTVTGYTVGNRQRPVVTASAGTNLGGFNNPDVNINPGDMFRLLDSDGSLLESVEVASLVDGTNLKLAQPLVTSVIVGKSFEIWLRQAPVPHEQSNEQLLELITDRQVSETTANWVAGTGGFCTTTNQLQDSQKDITGFGIQKGDIVVIDPMGFIPREGGLPVAQEKGVRPIGDTGVPDRGNPPWVAGTPSQLDDNRGYYRVNKVVSGASPYLELNPVSTFAGGPSSGQWVIFGSPGFEYAVYPTVSLGTEEGQMDLRVTHDRDPVTKSFQGTDLSIQPFSYRVIRPSALFSDDAIDLVLMMRERMLSWMEMLGWGKYGSYHDFQQYQHISDIGNFYDPADGLGVMSNAYIESLLGELGTTPYLNNRYCLSLLDRRFWILDMHLDSLTTLNAYQMKKYAPGDPAPYTAYNTTGSVVRPVLPDRIDLVLDQTDRFRSIRYVWLAYRVHKILGTLAAIQRYDEELPERLAEQKRLAVLQESVEKIG